MKTKRPYILIASLVLLLALALPGWATNYYVDSSATITGSQTSGTFVAGDWLMQATTNAKARYMSGTGPITVSAITPGQPTSTANQNPSTTGVWTDISAAYTFTITGPALPVTTGALYTNNGQTFSVNTTIPAGAGSTTLITTGTGAPTSSGTLTLPGYIFTVTAGTAVSAGAQFTNNGQTFTVLLPITSTGTILWCSGTGAATQAYAGSTLTGIGGEVGTNLNYSVWSIGGTGTGCPTTIAFSANTTSQGATFTPSGAPSYNGSNSNAGTSSGAPWQTLTYACANAVYTGGNSILMKCADTFVDFIGLYGGGTSTSSMFNVNNYGSGPNPQLYGAIPKYGSDWHQAYVFTISSHSASVGAQYTDSVTGNTFTVLQLASSATTLVCSGNGAPSASGTLNYVSGTPTGNITFSAVSTQAFYCYFAGWSKGLVQSNSTTVYYDLDGDSLPQISTLTTLAGSPGWDFDSTNSILYINLTGISPAVPGGVNPITSHNILWPCVYEYGFLSNYSGTWGANNPGAMSGGIYPQISYLNISNLDICYSAYPVFLGDIIPVYCSSFCQVYNINLWYCCFAGICNMGTYNNVTGCTTHHCKGGPCAAFGFWGQGGEIPTCAYDNFFNCIFADNVYATAGSDASDALEAQTQGGSTGVVASCGWYNTTITGNCGNLVYLDYRNNGCSLMTLQNTIVTGQVVCLIDPDGAVVNGLTIDGLYCPTAPSSSNLSPLAVTYTGGTNIILGAFINAININGAIIQVWALPSGASLGVYNSILIGTGTLSSYAASLTNSSGSTISFCNNVGVNCHYGFKYSTAVPCTFKNNIGYAVDMFMWPPSATPANLTSDFNYGYDTDSNGWAYASGWITLANWRTTTGQDTHSFQSTSATSPPGFVNGSGNLNQPTDFALKSGSPCINAGVNVGLTENIPDIGAIPYAGRGFVGF